MNNPQPGALTEWLRIMLGEVARKQDDAARAAVERKLRQQGTPPAAGARPADGKTA